MISQETSKLRIIQSKNPKEFEEQFEKLMQEILGKNPNIMTGFDSSIGHYAHIRWEETIKIPEDARDEANLKGIKYYCGDCPFFVLQKDRRIKNSVCGQGIKTYYEHHACVKLYEMIERGEVEM